TFSQKPEREGPAAEFRDVRPARQEQAKSLPPFQEAKPKGCGTLVTHRPDDVRGWPFLLLSGSKEFKLPPARPYCCAEELLCRREIDFYFAAKTQKFVRAKKFKGFVVHLVLRGHSNKA